MFSKLILSLPQMSANVDQTSLLKCFRYQNVTSGVQIKKISARSARSIVL